MNPELIIDSKVEVPTAKGIFEKYGLSVIKKDGGNNVNHLLAGKSLVINLLNEYITLANDKGGLGLKKENGFRELVHKDIGRYDLNMDHLISGRKSHRIFSDHELSLQDIYTKIEAKIKPYLAAYLGESYIPNAFGAVISHPNTEAQNWHVDSSHLYQIPVTKQEEILSHPHHLLPCHFVTVFCPLYEFSNEIGPTEIALASHQYTGLLKNQVVEDQYPSPDMVQWLLSRPEIERTFLEVEVGDIAIMDGRTLHRGSKNQSAETVRPLLYFSFCQPWYNEYPRSQNDERSLFQ